jgi:hypothetical protein
LPLHRPWRGQMRRGLFVPDSTDIGHQGSGVGLSSTHPSSLKNDWSLRFGKPLITPSRAAPEYLACIFTSSLTAALPWFHSWVPRFCRPCHGCTWHWPATTKVCDARDAQNGAPCVLCGSVGRKKHYRGVCDRPPPTMCAIGSRHKAGALAFPLRQMAGYAKW